MHRVWLQLWTSFDGHVEVAFLLCRQRIHADKPDNLYQSMNKPSNLSAAGKPNGPKMKWKKKIVPNGRVAPVRSIRRNLDKGYFDLPRRFLC